MRGWLRNGIRNGAYALIAFLCLVMVKLLFQLRVRGREHIERDGEYIVVARHRSYWDVPVVAAAIGISRRVQFISRKGLMRGVPGVRAVIRAFSTSIDRENFGRSDFRKMLTAMKTEKRIGLFPEGTTRARVDAKAGAIHFARLTGKRILPVNITSVGPYPPDYPFGLPQLRVSIGEPFDVSELTSARETAVSRSEQVRQMSEQLMARVDNA